MFNSFHADFVVSIRSLTVAPDTISITSFSVTVYNNYKIIILYVDSDTRFFRRPVGFVPGQGSILLDMFLPMLTKKLLKRVGISSFQMLFDRYQQRINLSILFPIFTCVRNFHVSLVLVLHS